jgi:bifunctional enzyme CysN/CysC
VDISSSEYPRGRRSGGTVWLTGLSASGKSTIGARIVTMLDSICVPAFLLDGDEIREGLNSDLGYREEDRTENVRRLGEVAILLSLSGQTVFVASISPFCRDREAVRSRHAKCGVSFVEVHIATPLPVCEMRDTKGLYKRARSGTISDFTGVSQRYEVPVSPEFVLDNSGDLTASASELFEFLHGRISLNDRLVRSVK